MANSGLTLDDVTDVEDFSPSTLLALVTRLESSTTFQEHIAREIELDEVWRRVETVLKAAREDPAGQAERGRLQALFDLVAAAHDLAGEGEPLAAADRLRQAINLQQSG
jgi:hypothetical protein